MSLHGGTLAAWTAADVNREFAEPYARYEQRRSAGYREYFRQHPDRASDHPMLASDLAAALPEGWAQLGTLLPAHQRHRWHLSGKSSQTLALGLLGPARTLDWSGSWLTELGAPEPQSPAPELRFEFDVPAELLGEHPRPTSIDFLAHDPGFVMACEAKWTETGMGTCSYQPKTTVPKGAGCSERVLDRLAYWQTAHDFFALPERTADRPCPLHPSYQAVRNVAAALALAGPDRTACFTLLYDQENPYFAGASQWPGWVEMLDRTLDGAHPRLHFTAVSWQVLVPRLPLDDQVSAWAMEKHALPADPSV